MHSYKSFPIFALFLASCTAITTSEDLKNLRAGELPTVALVYITNHVINEITTYSGLDSIYREELNQELAQCMIPYVSEKEKQINQIIQYSTNQKYFEEIDMLKSKLQESTNDQKRIILSNELKKFLEHEIFPIVCGIMDLSFKCIPLAKSVSNLPLNSSEVIDVTYKYFEALSNSICEKNGESIFELLESGFMSCVPDWSKHYNDCELQYGPDYFDVQREYTSGFDLCWNSLRKQHNCAYEIRHLRSETCHKEAIKVFQRVFARVDRYVKSDCEIKSFVRSLATRTKNLATEFIVVIFSISIVSLN